MSQPPYPPPGHQPPGYQPPGQYAYQSPPPPPVTPQPPPPVSQPSAVAYVPPPLAFRGYRPSRGLAVAAVVTAALWTVTEVVEGAVAWPAGDMYAQSARDRVPVENTVMTAYDATAFVWLLLAAAAYVAGCLLLWRLRKNAEVLSSSPHTRSAGWVWAGWVVPFVLLWFPYQVVRDIKDATAPYARVTLVGWWWTLWLLSYVTTTVAGGLVPASGIATESSAQALGAVETVDAFVVTIGFALWCRLVLRIVKDQDRAAGATG